MLLERIDSAQRVLEKAVGVMSRLEITPPVGHGVVNELEESLGSRLPESLRAVFTQEAAGLRFRWESDQFGSSCSGGDAWLLGPEAMAAQYELHLGVVAEASRDGLGGEDEGYGALIQDWPRWIPLFRFPSGDCFCFEVGGPAKEEAIVFLEHDVMDQGPNLHGMRLAKNFEDLVLRWSEVLFADVYDWSLAVVGERIDRRAEIFQPLLNTIES